MHDSCTTARYACMCKGDNDLKYSFQKILESTDLENRSDNTVVNI